MSTPPVLTRAIALGALLVPLAACSDIVGGGGRAPLSLSFASRPAGTSATRVGFDPSRAATVVTSGGHSLDLTAVTLGVSRIELESSAGEDASSDCEENHGCSGLVTTPLDVDLSVNGGVVTVKSLSIPAGTYRDVELKFATVRLQGTYDGQAFDVTLPVNLEREIEFNPPLVVGATTPPNLTIEVPTTTWLRNSDGSLVDPRALATNTTLREQVVSRIRASLRAFRDDDRDDLDDDHEDADHGGH